MLPYPLVGGWANKGVTVLQLGEVINKPNFRLARRQAVYVYPVGFKSTKDYDYPFVQEVVDAGDKPGFKITVAVVQEPCYQVPLLS